MFLSCFLLLASRLGKLLKFFSLSFIFAEWGYQLRFWATSHRKSNSVFKQWRGSVADIAEDQRTSSSSVWAFSLPLCLASLP